MTTWSDKAAISTMLLPSGVELAVVKWATCWGWHIDPSPNAPIHEGKPFLAKGRGATREEGKIAALTALGAISTNAETGSSSEAPSR